MKTSDVLSSVNKSLSKKEYHDKFQCVRQRTF